MSGLDVSGWRPRCPATVESPRSQGQKTDCIGRGNPVPEAPGQYKCRLCSNVWVLTPQQQLAEFEAATAHGRRS